MNRRFFLRAALVVTGAAALLGGTIFMRRGIVEGRLTDSGREALRGIARGVLSHVLPAEPGALDVALTRHISNMETFLGGLPRALQLEISLLLGVLGNTASRTALTYMPSTWDNASTEQIHAALEAMRIHPIPTHQMAYHAVRDVTTLVFFAQPENWPTAGYPGPTEL